MVMGEKLRGLWNQLPPNVRLWVKGLFAAVEGGVAGAVLQLLADPTHLCYSMDCLKHYGGAVVAGAAVAVRFYLTQSPIKPVIEEAIDPKSLSATAGK